MLSSVLLISVAVIVVTAKSIEDGSRNETEMERVTYGNSAQPGQFPWAAALHYNGRFICTCSIISSRTVLTAAHCVILNGRPQPAGSFFAIANVRRTTGSVRINFASVIPHPNYNDQNLRNDVAVFHTTEPIPFTDEVGPVCLAGPNTRMRQYQRATVMGWGDTLINGILPNLPEDLRYAEQIIVPNSLCIANPDVIRDKMCATGINPIQGACRGDSGGPLVAMNEDRPVQIGITSYINALIGCGKINPAVFTRVSSQYNFIMRNANDPGNICTV